MKKKKKKKIKKKKKKKKKKNEDPLFYVDGILVDCCHLSFLTLSYSFTAY
jgi:hypothetical protein